MPAIDLARLRKQANRLADFFFLPEEFVRHLREILEFYVNYTMRRKETVAPGSTLPTFRTPKVVLRHLENELNLLAIENPSAALELADRLWDEGYLETRQLAAFLLGRIPPQEELLLTRLTAWTQQVRDPDVRAALLTTSLKRIREETPDDFLILISEWLHPARQRLWSNGIQALLPLITNPKFENLPPIFEITRPIIEAAPGAIQTDIRDLLSAYFRASKTETVFYLREILENSNNPLTVVTLRRILPGLPEDLQKELRQYVRPQKSR
ncbi:MAG: hypothetical protein Kow002_21330 [Anaerolineales bacterium]